MTHIIYFCIYRYVSAQSMTDGRTGRQTDAWRTKHSGGGEGGGGA